MVCCWRFDHRKRPTFDRVEAFCKAFLEDYPADVSRFCSFIGLLFILKKNYVFFSAGSYR